MIKKVENQNDPFRQLMDQDNQKNKPKPYTSIAIILLVIIPSLVWLFSQQSEIECNVPERMWLLVFFFIFGFSLVHNVIFLQYCWQPLDLGSSLKYCQSKVLLQVPVILFLVGWLFYGLSLYNSEDNNCADIESTQSVNTFLYWVLVLTMIPLVLCLFSSFVVSVCLIYQCSAL